METLIAVCGLDCEKCEARIATLNNDDGMKARVAKEWSALNGVEITPDMIHCVGCRADGVKTPYCQHICPIRKCAIGKGLDTCGDCSEMDGCKTLEAILSGNPQARENLKEYSSPLIG